MPKINLEDTLDEEGLEEYDNKYNYCYFESFYGACDHFDTLNYLVGSHGDYWSSNVNKSDRCGAYGLYFDSRSKQTNRYSYDYGHSVRLVSDVPFEGGIKFGNIYWKPENEKGYYSQEDAERV